MSGNRTDGEVRAMLRREVFDSYRQLRRAEIIRASFRRESDGRLVDRVLRERRHRSRHRSAAARFDRAVLALEAHLGRTPGHRPRDFVELCREILSQESTPEDGD
ncbi:MAG: hypothetical protein ACRCYQ_08930 [Nocardioides sp.]